MGAAVFSVFHSAIVESIEEERIQQQIKKTAEKTDDDNDPPPPESPLDLRMATIQQSHKGKFLIYATVARQTIHYPTNLSLLNEARQFSEMIID